MDFNLNFFYSCWKFVTSRFTDSDFPKFCFLLVDFFGLTTILTKSVESFVELQLNHSLHAQFRENLKLTTDTS